jgi:HSP20 family molecular chaperone IbpA
VCSRPFLSLMTDDDFFDTPLLLTGDLGQGQGQGQQQKQLGSGQGQQLQVRDKGQQEETKMTDVDEKSQSTQLTQPQTGSLLQTFQPGRLMRARVNIEDAGDKYVVTAEMPSFDKQNIKVNVTDDGLLTIKGQSMHATDRRSSVGRRRARQLLCGRNSC